MFREQEGQIHRDRAQSGVFRDCQYFSEAERSRWLMGMTKAIKKTEPELGWLPWRDLQEGLLNEASKVKKNMHSMVSVL